MQDFVNREENLKDMRRFGLALAQWLSQKGAKALLLTSKRGLRTGAQSKIIQQLRNQGTQVCSSDQDTLTIYVLCTRLYPTSMTPARMLNLPTQFSMHFRKTQDHVDVTLPTRASADCRLLCQHWTSQMLGRPTGFCSWPIKWLLWVASST